MRYSFVLPVYGTEKYLPRCLDSIFAQTERDFEVIVVDDCSPGNCAEVVARYGDRVRYVRHDRNRGAFQARVSGVRAATGDYIVPVDPDDYVMPELLARLDGMIGADDSDVVSYWMENDCGGRISPHWYRYAGETESADAFIHALAIQARNYSIVSKVIRRSTYLEAADGLGTCPYVNTAEDFLATLLILLRSRRVAHLSFAGYRYFRNSESITATRRTEQSFRKACEQASLAGNLVLAEARRQGKDRQVVEDLEAVCRRLECYFCEEVLNGPADCIVPFVRILGEIFPSGAILETLAQECVTLGEARPRRLSDLLLGFFRKILRRRPH